MQKSVISLPRWSRPDKLDNAATSSRPALVNTGNRLLLVFKGKESTNLWYWQSNESGRVWDKRPDPIIGHTTRMSPALASRGDNKAQLIYTGGTSEIIWETDFSGGNWGKSSQIKDRKTDGSPAIAIREDTLFLAHGGGFQDPSLYWAYRGSKRWSPSEKIGSIKLATDSTDLGMTEFQGSIYIAYLDQQGGMNYTRLAPDQDWSFPKKIPFDNPGGAAPALGVSPDGKYLLFVVREQSERQLLQIAFDGENWSDVGIISNHLSRRPPSLATLNGRFHMVHRGQDSPQIWISRSL